MKRISALGAAALLALGLYATVSTVASASPVVTAVEDVCPEEGKAQPGGNQPSVLVTAPDGMVITGYCVKAGSAQQEEGPEYEYFDSPVTEVTITHSSGKDISHYTVFYAPAPTPTPTPTPSEEPTPTPTPTPSEEPTPTPTPEPSEKPTPKPEPEPSEKPVPVGQPANPSAPPSELASTGPAETVGYAMVALSLAGGGVALMVMARRRLA